MRTAEIARKTNETDVRLSLNLDGRGEGRSRSGVGFLDHMLTLLARHGGMDLELTCEGDTQVDDHHSVEDIGIALGQAFDQALGEKRGVRRYASLCLPMDEALILCAVDLSGRGGHYEELAIPTEKIGSFDTQHRGRSLQDWAAPRGRRRRPIPGSGTKFHPPKGCCKRETPC